MQSPPKRQRQAKANPDRLKGIQQPLAINQAEALAIGFDGGERPLKAGDRVRCSVGEGSIYRLTDTGAWVLVGTTARPYNFADIEPISHA
jgi:hypothetical protein